jgi:hypothetical protein
MFQVVCVYEGSKVGSVLLRWGNRGSGYNVLHCWSDSVPSSRFGSVLSSLSKCDKFSPRGSSDLSDSSSADFACLIVWVGALSFSWKNSRTGEGLGWVVRLGRDICCRLCRGLGWDHRKGCLLCSSSVGFRCHHCYGNTHSSSSLWASPSVLDE